MYFIQKCWVDINEVDDRGNTPLHFAIQGGHKTVFEKLCELGADILIRNKFQRTPVNCFSTMKNLRNHDVEMPESILFHKLGDSFTLDDLFEIKEGKKS